MRLWIVLVGGVVGMDDYFIAPHNMAKLQAARREEVSFMDSTIHSMESNQETVLRSNALLDKQVLQSERELEKATADVDRIQQHTRELLSRSTPDVAGLSLLQTKASEYYGDGSSDRQFNLLGDDDADTPELFRNHASKPMSVIERARAKAEAAKQKFQKAMEKLAEDKKKLLDDEAFRRARAAQERRHVHALEAGF